jgi:outer membrane lipoprotein-sorting protein
MAPMKFVSVLSALLLAAPLLGGGPALAFTETELAAVKRAETYLNQLGNLEARFLQVNPDGGAVEGDLYVARPGRMRIQYDPPTPMLVVADGVWLIYVDKEVNEASYLGLDETPAGLLLKKDLSFTAPGVALKGVTLGPGTVEITAAQKKSEAQGRVTFVFSEAPFELRQWRVLDAQNKEVTVTLFDAKTGGELAKNLFEYAKPEADSDRARD